MLAANVGRKTLLLCLIKLFKYRKDDLSVLSYSEKGGHSYFSLIFATGTQSANQTQHLYFYKNILLLFNKIMLPRIQVRWNKD